MRHLRAASPVFPWSRTKGEGEEGFTLLEILIAFFLFTIMASALYTSYTGVFMVVSKTETESDIYQMARTTMERLIDDLESAYIVSPPPGTLSRQENALLGFVGEKEYLFNERADFLRFPSTAHVSFEAEEQTAGLAIISYHVRESDGGGEKRLDLHRADMASASDLLEQGQGGLPICEDVKSVAFTYFNDDGLEFDAWDSSDEESEGKPPRVVAIRLEIMNRGDMEKPFVFETKVLIPHLSVSGSPEIKSDGAGAQDPKTS